MVLQRHSRGVTLVEVVLAATLLTMALLAIGLTLSTSVRASGYARGLQVGRQAAAELADRLRAVPRASVYTQFWGDNALEVTDIDGTAWVSGADPGFVLETVRASVLEPAVQRGWIGPPAAGPQLALRFISEEEYNALTSGSIDLDSDGSFSNTFPAPATAAAAPRYFYFPVLIRCAWTGELGPQVHTLLTVVGADEEVEPGR